MKKILSSAIFAAVLLCGASCAKDRGGIMENPGDAAVTFRSVTPHMATKTVLGDEEGTRSIIWSENDSVSIHYGTAENAFRTTKVGQDGEISVKIPASDEFYAIYPHTAAGRMTAEGFRITVPAVQDGSFSNGCIMAAYSDSTRLLRFQTAVSMLAIDVEDPEITEITIRANDGAPVAGEALLTFDRETGAIGTVMTGAVTIDEITLEINGAGRYYAGILPRAELARGIGFNIFKNGRSSGVLSVTPIASETTQIVNVGAPEKHLLPEGDIFIRQNGTGNGESWTSAGGPELLKRLLNTAGGMDGVTVGWRLSGKKIYIAEGTYELSREGDPLTVSGTKDTIRIVGGFPDGSAGKETDRYAPDACKTVFKAASGSRIMNIRGEKLLLKGIVFSDASGSLNGGAIACEDKNAEVFMQDCTVSGNTVSGHGAGLYITGGTFRLDGCTLSGNTGTGTLSSSKKESEETFNASRGGAIYAEGPDAMLYINRCAFRANVAYAAPDIQLRRGASAFVYRTYFLSSAAMAPDNVGEVYPGRSVDADAMPSGTRGKLCMCDCTISRTSSLYSGNGGLPLVAASDYFCLLVQNTLVDGAVALVRNNNNRLSAKDPDLVWIISNLLVNSSFNAINLAKTSAQHGFYNMLDAGKNSYAVLAETDTRIAETEFASLDFDSADGIYRWSTDKQVNRPSENTVSDLVKDSCAGFHDWLGTLCAAPFGTDLLGTRRNAGATMPGSWDAGM